MTRIIVRVVIGGLLGLIVTPIIISSLTYIVPASHYYEYTNIQILTQKLVDCGEIEYSFVRNSIIEDVDASNAVELIQVTNNESGVSHQISQRGGIVVTQGTQEITLKKKLPCLGIQKAELYEIQLILQFNVNGQEKTTKSSSDQFWIEPNN